MNSKEIKETHLAYLAVYDQDLREQMEDEGLILPEDRAPGVKPYKPGPTGAEVRADAKAAAQKKAASDAGKSGYGPDEKFNKPDDKIKKPGTTVPAPKKGGYGRIMSNIPHGIGAHRDKIASRITTITGKDPGAPRSQKMTPKNEEVDLYDIILSHLIDEGYADTFEAAEVIMVNMSEDWRNSIIG